MADTFHIGFTGTRHGLNLKQKFELIRALQTYALGKGEMVFHHGCCIGADNFFHRLGMILGVRIVLHPPEDKSAVVLQHFMDVPEDDVMPSLPYLARNKQIVDTTQMLIAGPDGPERQRSGTWSTVRYAWAQNRKPEVTRAKPVILLDQWL